MAHHKHFDRQKAAHRGWIYKFHSADGEDLRRYALVVSAEDRKYDKVVSIILLSDFRTYQNDEVKVRVNGINYYAHCGNVTFCKRYQLGGKVAVCEPIIMMRIDAKIPGQLGLDASERRDFETLYYDLLRTLDIAPEPAEDDKEESYGIDRRKENWFTRMRQRLLRI